MITTTVLTPEYLPGALALARSLSANSELRDPHLRALCFNFTDSDLSYARGFMTCITPQLRYEHVYRAWALKYRQWAFTSVRIHLQDFFPGVERILYLDADMLCIGSLRELDRLKMGDAPWAAVLAPDEGRLHNQTNLSRATVNGNLPATNTGLQLYNMPAWLARNTTERFAKHASHKAFDHPLNGEGLMNYIDRGAWLPLDPKFNVPSNRYEHGMDARILHFKGARKPWMQNGRHRDLWKPYMVRRDV